VTLAEIHAAGAHDFIAKPAPAGELEFRARAAFRLSEERARRSKHEQRLVDWARQLEKTRRLLESTVCIDPLTGIANRRHFDALLRAEWRRAARDGTDLAVVFFDLDEFHAFNERYGHVGGDACLVRVARTLAHGLRRASDVLARYGGEELVAILPETDAVGAAVVAERLRARIEALQVPHAASPTGVVTLSAGVASHRPDGATTAEQLIAAADGALYRAKRDGRNRWRAEGIDEDRVIVRREPWPTPPVVILDPVLASRVPRFLAAVRGELSTSDDENAVARLRASATRIESTAIDLGLSQIGALASALGTAPLDTVRSHISELAWYVEHVQVVYRRAG
jgi:diguanylate cyclase (GGDEF)-like protein